jgi:hypothetical protein
MLVGRAEQAMSRFARCGVDLLLAGHFHLSHSGPTAVRYASGAYSSIFIQAGTACSTRGRGEPNSFNAIQIDGEIIQLTTLSSVGAKPFLETEVHRFKRTPSGWYAEIPAKGP